MFSLIVDSQGIIICPICVVWVWETQITVYLPILLHWNMKSISTFFKQLQVCRTVVKTIKFIVVIKIRHLQWNILP